MGNAIAGDQFLSMEVGENLPVDSSSCGGRLADGTKSASLAFLASGSSGFYIVDVTNPKAIDHNANAILGHFDTDGQVARFGVDPLHDLLYVADGGQGVKVYDIHSPCTSGIAGLSDPRLIAQIPVGGNANVPFLIDPATGVAYGSAQDTSAAGGTVFTFALFPPPVAFVADTDRDGRWEAVTSTIPLGVANATKATALRSLGEGGLHSPYPADTVRVLASIAGGAGPEITMEVDSANPNGFTLPPAPPGFPKEKNVLLLRRQSEDSADPAYNRYLSPPIVLLADPRAQAQYERTAAESTRPTPTPVTTARPIPPTPPSSPASRAEPTYGTRTPRRRPPSSR